MVCSDLNQTKSFDTATLETLDTFTLSTFPAEDALEEKSVRNFWEYYKLQL